MNVLKIGEDIGALGFIILAFLGLVFGGTFFKNIFYLIIYNNFFAYFLDNV